MYCNMTSCTIRPSVEEISDFMARRFSGKTPPPEGSKTALIMVGGPGSGKSSTKSKTLRHLHFDEDTFVDVDPDEALGVLFGNDNGCRLAATIENGKVFSRAWKGGYNIIYDGTGKNFANYSKNPVRYLKRKGYNVILCITLLDVEEAKKRISRRAEKTGRDIGEEFTEDVYGKLEKGIPEYLGIKCTDLDAILVYDNNGSTTRLLHEMFCNSHPRESVSLSGATGSNPQIIPVSGGGRKRRKKSVKRRKLVGRRKSFKRRNPI